MDQWRLDKLNNLFIISIVVHPDYRKGEAIILLGNSLLDFLRNKDKQGYRVGTIAGSAISDGGANFIKRLHGSFIKEIDGGYKYFLTDNTNARRLISDGLLLKKL